MINSNQGHELLKEVEQSIAREYEWSGYFPPVKEEFKPTLAVLKKLERS